ncbi:uncharacterized protein LOC113870082 [Abrus precatorius]|uniref:Uncharacterized protein LOC113870082 n=1 Tax=Abrus precatorius TaxID=3816 RepID=A0A8B8M437_ABRPR|nr:uncharacterized protein LOC113870082 [Abrus precatorius]
MKHESVKAMPFSLVYGAETVLPIDMSIPSARIMLNEQEEQALTIEGLEDKSEEASQELLKNHRRIILAYDKMVRPRMFTEGELVMKSTYAIMKNQAISKWAAKWEGPYVVQETNPSGYCTLENPKTGKRVGPLNFKYVKKFYM